MRVRQGEKRFMINCHLAWELALDSTADHSSEMPLFLRKPLLAVESQVLISSSALWFSALWSFCRYYSPELDGPFTQWCRQLILMAGAMRACLVITASCALSKLRLLANGIILSSGSHPSYINDSAGSLPCKRWRYKANVVTKI